jgi:hypothetical protein
MVLHVVSVNVLNSKLSSKLQHNLVFPSSWKEATRTFEYRHLIQQTCAWSHHRRPAVTSREIERVCLQWCDMLFPYSGESEIIGYPSSSSHNGNLRATGLVGIRCRVSRAPRPALAFSRVSGTPWRGYVWQNLPPLRGHLHLITRSHRCGLRKHFGVGGVFNADHVTPNEGTMNATGRRGEGLGRLRTMQTMAIYHPTWYYL